jgi:hypothetical protein
VGDLPDYQKKIVVLTVAGEYPALMQIDVTEVKGATLASPTITGCLPISIEHVADMNHLKIKGVTLKDPTVASCLPISIEHVVQIDHEKILGVALKSPTVAQSIPTSIENAAIAYDATNDRFKVDIEKMTVGTIDVNITDKWARQLGLVDLSRVLGAALSYANPVIVRLTNGSAFIDPTDVADRAARLLGIAYGNKGQLQQRTTSLDLLVQLTSAGVEINPQTIRALTSSDVVTVVQSTPANLTATVTQAAKDRTISSVDATATALQINIAALNGNSAALYTPAGGKAVRIKFVSLEHSADVDIGYRFGAAGTIYYLRTTKGVYVSNLIGANNQGAADAVLYLNSSGATNVKGYIMLVEV